MVSPGWVTDPASAGETAVQSVAATVAAKHARMDLRALTPRCFSIVSPLNSYKAAFLKSSCTSSLSQPSEWKDWRVNAGLAL